MGQAAYKFRFWGARGTIPCPSLDKLEYGGNTSCIEIDLGDGEHVILDCGSGLRPFGASLASRDQPSRRFHLFLSHYHFDHLEGLPLFGPLYDARNEIAVYGADSCGKDVKTILQSLVQPPYFPVTLADVPSQPSYHKLNGEPVQIRDLTLSTVPLNHPDGCLSFRIDRGDRRIVYATDHEHGNEAIDDALVRHAEGADYLIYDATYEPAEYEEMRKGWGHSTWYAAVQTAMQAKVKNLILFHHHPDYADSELSRVVEIARREFPTTIASREGLELDL